MDFLIRWIYVKKKICVPKSMFHGGAARHYHVNWIFNHERDGYYTSTKNTGMSTTQSCVQAELKSYFHLSEKAHIQPASFCCCWPHFWNIGQNTDIDFWYRSWSNNEPLIFPNILTFLNQFFQSHLLCIGRHGHSSAHQSCMWLCLGWTLGNPKTWVSWNENIKTVCGEKDLLKDTKCINHILKSSTQYWKYS